MAQHRAIGNSPDKMTATYYTQIFSSSLSPEEFSYASDEQVIPIIHYIDQYYESNTIHRVWTIKRHRIR